LIFEWCLLPRCNWILTLLSDPTFIRCTYNRLLLLFYIIYVCGPISLGIIHQVTNRNLDAGINTKIISCWIIFSENGPGFLFIYGHRSWTTVLIGYHMMHVKLRIHRVDWWYLLSWH